MPACGAASPKWRRCGKVPQNYDPLRAAFYVSDDYTSLASLAIALSRYRLADSGGAARRFGRWPPGRRAGPEAHGISAIAEGAERRSAGDVDGQQLRRQEEGWCPPEMLEMLANPAARQHLATQIEEYADAEHEPGIVVDFESLPESSQKDFQDFIHDLGAALHAQEPEADGRAAGGRLQLRLQVFRLAGRRHHPDELRFPLAALRRPGPSRRRIGSCQTSTTC